MANYYLGDNGELVDSKKKKKKGKNYTLQSNGTLNEVKTEDIAPVKETKKDKTEERTWFQKGAYGKLENRFKDGYQFGDVSKTLGDYWKAARTTEVDMAEDFAAGFMGVGEKVVDAGATFFTMLNQGSMSQAAIAEMQTNALSGKKVDAGSTLKKYQDAQDELEKDTAKFVAKDLYDENKVAKKIITAPYEKRTGVNVEEDSVLGDKSDSLVQSGGQLAAQLVADAILHGSGTALMATSAFGSEAESAFKQGATFDEAVISSTISAGAEMLSEKLGGVKFGGKTLTDVTFSKLSSKMTNKLTKALITAGKIGADATAEGLEEVFSGYMSAIGQKLTYMKDKEIEELFSNEDLLESFIGGMVLGGAFGGGEALISGRNSVNGMTSNEQAVVDKVYNDVIAEQEKGGKKLTSKEKQKIYENIVEKMDKGDIDIDTIEEVLGGSTFKEYKSITEKEKTLTDEISQLENTPDNSITVKQRERLLEAREELKNITNKTELKTKLSDEVYGIAKNSRLVESYNEKARKGQAFEADLTQYTGKQRAAVERAVKSGVLNNTNKSHALVDTLSKIEADKGIIFDYTDNAKLKESGFAIEGKTVNGFVKNGAVTLNVHSSKAWQSTVGHEITHILEGTDSYTELQSALFEYAESKGELASRKAALTELYNGIDADIDAELTADLVGDYLFSDSDFVKGLTTNKNLFQKIYDEIKYLCRVATGKELTEIEKVKAKFDKAWDELAVKESLENEATDTEVDDVQYSVSIEDTKTLDFLNEQVEKGEYDAEKNPDGGYYVTYKSMSYWGEDENGNAILRSPMAEYVDGELSNAYLIPKDKSKLNWYQATETIDENTGLPTGLLVKTKKEGNKSFSYLPAAENQDLIAEDWSNLYFNLQKKVLKNGKWVNSDVPARYNPYEHSSNSMLNDQFSAAYLRDNLVTVKMYVPISEDNGTFRAKYSKDPTGWAEWKTGTVAGKINKQKDLQRKVYLSRYAAPVEIVPDSEVAQAYKEYLDGTDVTIPDNVVSPNLLNELKKAGVPIEESGKVKYSVSEDSQKTDSAYLKIAESGNTEIAQKMVDDAAKNAGYDIKAYHGTGYDFTVFDKSRQGDNYEDWGRLGKGFYFAPTSREAETWAELSKGGKNKVMPVYLRSENMLDSFEALPDNLKDTIPENWDSLTRRLAEKYAYNYIEYMQEFGYNVQEILTQKGYDGINGHTEFVVFDPEQVKSADAITYDDKGNIIPLSQRFNTANDDIRFSLSKPVEETKNLVALHNLNANKLNKVLDLGGFPMPSIAVTRTDIPHTNFGDITLVMNKSTVDPKANRKNTVYSADAWTPTVPPTEYKPDNNRLREISNKIYGLVGDRNIANALDYVTFDTDNVSRDLANYDGNIVEKYLDNHTLKYAFLKDIGAEIDLPKKAAKLSRGVSNEAVRYFSGKLVNGLQTVELYRNMSATEMLNDKELTNAVAEVLNWDILRQVDEGTEAYEKLKANPLYKAEDLSFSQIDALLSGVRKYFNYGIDETIDGKEAKNVITRYINWNELQKQYETWLNEMFEGVVEKTGIYNNKDIFTPSGNRRTFEQLHLPVTLDNIVKAMASQNNGNTKNVAGFNGVKTLRAGMAERFKSIDDMHKLEGRLQHLTTEEFDAIHDQLADRMYKIINSVLETAPDTSGNIYMRQDSVGETLMEIAESGNYDTDAIINTVNQYIYNIDENIANDIRTLLYDVSQMPTNMFEAKPERAVGFDEVNAVILPNTTDNSLRDRLESMGVKVVTYEKGSDADRLNKLNSLLEEQPDWKFSLSKQGEEFAPVGNYNTPLNETALAPIREDIAENATTTFEDDIAPMPSDADVPPEMETGYYNTPDTTALDEKALKDIAKTLKGVLYLNPKETKAIQDIVQKYSTSETPNQEALFNEIKEQFGEKTWTEKNEDIAEVKREIRSYKLQVSDTIKSDIAHNYDKWSKFRKTYSGKINFNKDGLPVDVAYMELSEAYPSFFPEDITNATDQLLRIAEVADLSIRENQSQPLYDEEIQKAVDIISSEVNNYKQNILKEAAESTAEEDLNGVAPAKAVQLTDGTARDAHLLQSLDNYPIKTVEDKITEKLRATETELAENKQLMRESVIEYNKEIDRLSQEYLSKKDKNTKVANNIIRRIANLEKLKASVEADYSKRISDLEARVKKMKDPIYNRAMHKQAKMQEHAKWAENLIGDTSTWVDKKLGLQYSTNTERRNLRDIVRDENGNVDIARADKIDDELNGRYNREQANINRELAQTRKKYADLKITNAESVYIQMLGEFKYNPETTLTEDDVKKYYEKHQKKIDVDKVNKVIEMARQDFDSLLERLNAELRNQGMKEIPYRKGYFPHFTNPKQNFIQKLFNWKTQDNEIPTSIAGLTETFKPVRSYQSFDKTRHSDTTDYNFLQGFDTYLDGALDWIYHIDTLQKRRAVENYIRYTHSEEGIKAEIEKVYANEELDANEAQAQIEHILAQAKNPLNNFVQDFMTHTNILTNKKNSYDRMTEQAFNRKIYSTMTNIQNRMSANMVLANVRSALTNFIPITQSWGQVSPLRSLQATKDTIANAIKDDGLINKSTYLTNRLREADKLYKTTWDKILDTSGIMFDIVDNFSSQVIWRSKYNQNIAKGMSESEAIKNADQFAENVMAGRSKGNEPTLFNAKNPFVKAFTMFQLEVNNQYGYLFKDMPNDLKAETNHWKLNLAKGYTTAFIGAYVYDALMTELTGSGAALNPIGIIEELLRDLGLFDDDEEKEADEVVTNLTKNVVEELPFVGGLFGGGRIPINAAIPYSDEYSGGYERFTKDTVDSIKAVGNWVSGEKADWSGAKNLGKELLNPLLNIGLPVGGGQIKKTVQGLNMFNTDEDHPVAGSYTDSGALRFPVEDTVGNRIKAGVFGQWANDNAREYLDNGYAPLKEKQIQEYIDTELPIADYWKYREGLSNLEPLEGKKSVTLNQKGDYIGGLDLPVSTKNILINNIADDRKTPIDYTGYENYADFEEFDFATRYPEKYAVLQEQGISVADYKKYYQETAFMYTDDYSWAANNPEQYTVSKAVTNDVAQYKQYTTDLYNIKADKYNNGESISGSRKEKVVNYVNNLNLDYGAKLILFKSEYPSDDTYNADIINYINNRNDLTYEERVTIYTELGFTVKDGYVYWD